MSRGNNRQQQDRGSRDDFRSASGGSRQGGRQGSHRSGPQDGPPLPKKEELVAAIKKKLSEIDDGHGTLSIHGETLTPTKNQKTLMGLIGQKDIVFVNGPVGTGKTFWSCFAALQGLAEGKFDHIALTAPAVEADENIGFLPGEMEEKMENHVRQMLETFDEMVGKGFRIQMQQTGLLEIAPHAFNRGVTYKRSLYILDESQNASARQLMTSIGRLGFKSTFVYMGDDRQNDRTTGQSAYVAFSKRFSDAAYAQRIGSVTMGKEDVRRHPLLQMIVERGDDRPLEGFEDRNDSRMRKVTAPQPSAPNALS
jgi:phosphate starvation-inducible protein PhoH and related proteins